MQTQKYGNEKTFMGPSFHLIYVYYLKERYSALQITSFN